MDGGCIVKCCLYEQSVFLYSIADYASDFRHFRVISMEKIAWRAKRACRPPLRAPPGKQWLIGLQKAVIIFG